MSYGYSGSYGGSYGGYSGYSGNTGYSGGLQYASSTTQQPQQGTTTGGILSGILNPISNFASSLFGGAQQTMNGAGQLITTASPTSGLLTLGLIIVVAVILLDRK